MTQGGWMFSFLRLCAGADVLSVGGRSWVLLFLRSCTDLVVPFVGGRSCGAGGRLCIRSGIGQGFRLRGRAM